MSDALNRQLDRAAQLLAQGRLPAALEEYRRIVQAVPGELAARQKIAEILARQGQVPAAVAEYSEVVKRYAEQGQFFKATALSRVILTLDPKHQLATKLLADLYASRPGGPPAHPERIRGPMSLGPALDASAIDLAFERALDPSQEPPEEIALEELLPEAEPPLPPRDALPHIPLFSSLTTEEFMAVLNGAMDAKTIRAGQAIVTEGQPGGSMFAVAQGSVSVWRENQRVAVMREGDFFGEMALLSGAPRTATVKAEGDVVVLEFPRESMAPVITKHPGVRTGLEQFSRQRMLANLMRANPLLQLLTEPQRQALSAAFQPCTFSAGEVVLAEGDAGAAVFLLLRGHCSVSQGTTTYPDLVEGDAFGEISVLTRLPVSATVKARDAVLALCVLADDFRSLVLANPEVGKKVQALASERMTRTAKMALQADADQWV